MAIVLSKLRRIFFAFLCAACFVLPVRAADVVLIDGTLIQAAPLAGDGALFEAHPRAVSGLTVYLEPGAGIEIMPGIEGSGKLFLQAISVSGAARVSVAVKDSEQKFDYSIPASSGWTTGADVSLKLSDKLVFSMADEAETGVLIDRLFFTTNKQAVVFGHGRRNNLTAWDPAFIPAPDFQTGNLVLNGGFETPFGGEWSPAWFSAFFLPNTARMEHEDGAGRFLRVPLDRYTSRHNEITVASGMIGTSSEKEYVFTCMLRGQGVCTVSLPGDMPSARQGRGDMGLIEMIEPVRVELSKEWQTVTANFSGGGNLIVQFAGTQGEHGSYMDIDNVAVYEAGLSGIPVPLLEAGLCLPDPARIFDKGLPLQTKLVARFGDKLDAEITLRCFDVFGRNIAEKTVSISGVPGELAEKPMMLDWIDEKPCGAYRLELWHGDTFLREHSFSVLPEPVARDNSSGFFGAYCAGSLEIVPVLKRLGITSVGTQNMASDISMLRTVFPGADKDVVVNSRYANLFSQAGLEVVSTFLGRPNWIAESPADEQLETFVSKVAQWADAYDGAISVVLGWMELRQVDNPDLFGKLSAAVIKGLSASDKPPAFMLGSGTPDQADVLTAALPSAPAGIAAQMRGWTDSDFEMFREFRDRTGVKLWDMESRIWRQSFYRQRPGHNSFRGTEFAVISPAWACGDLVKSLVRGRSLGGMERFMYYYMGPGSTWFGWLHYNSMTITDYDGSVHPIGVALAYLTSRLDGAEHAKRVDSGHDGIQMHAFSNSSGSTLVAWCDRPLAARISASADGSYIIRDITGRPVREGAMPLSRVPILVTSSSHSAAELAWLCVSALSEPVAGVPEYFFRDDSMFLKINGISPVQARPVAAEMPWMESAWNNPLVRDWREYADGCVPLSDITVPSVSRRFAEIKTGAGDVWQVPLSVLVSHPDKRMESGPFDSIILNARTHESSSSRGRPSSFFDLGVFVKSTYTPDTLTLVFYITDDNIRVARGEPCAGDALVLYLPGMDGAPLVIRPVHELTEDGALGVAHTVKFESGITALLARTKWGWRVSASVPASVLGVDEFKANENIPFAFAYRDADDSDIQQRTLRWGMDDFREKRDAGFIVIR